MTKSMFMNIKELSGRWPIGEKSFQQATKFNLEWYHLLILFICYQPKNVESISIREYTRSSVLHPTVNRAL